MREFVNMVECVRHSGKKNKEGMGGQWKGQHLTDEDFKLEYILTKQDMKSGSGVRKNDCQT